MIGVKFTNEEKKVFSRIGAVGGASTSKAKIKAAKRNAAKARAARTPKYERCPKYKNGSHRFGPDGRCHSPECRAKYPDLRRIES